MVKVLFHLWFIIYYIYGWILLHLWLTFITFMVSVTLWLIITFMADTASQRRAGD